MKQTVDKRVRKGTTINCVLRVLEDVIALFVGEKERERGVWRVVYECLVLRIRWGECLCECAGSFYRDVCCHLYGIPFLLSLLLPCLPFLETETAVFPFFFSFFLNPVVMQPLLLPTLVRKCNVDQSIDHQVNNRVQLMTKKEWNKNVGIQLPVYGNHCYGTFFLSFTQALSKWTCN